MLANSTDTKNNPDLSAPVITIDGPGGSGKGTISILLARSLGWHFLDSGALYRILAWAALEEKIDLTDENTLAFKAKTLKIQFDDAGIWCEGVQVKTLIRTESCGNAASKIAVLPKVREALLEAQRAFRKLPGLVADGRDMGTIVFKDAFLKIYLEASSKERAKRRYLELKERAQNVTLQSLLTEIEERDKRDKERETAPLKPAEDAVVIDTTTLGVEEVFEKVLTLAKNRLY